MMRFDVPLPVLPPLLEWCTFRLCGLDELRTCCVFCMLLLIIDGWGGPEPSEAETCLLNECSFRSREGMAWVF